jgi:hypothetical protein
VYIVDSKILSRLRRGAIQVQAGGASNLRMSLTASDKLTATKLVSISIQRSLRFYIKSVQMLTG